MQQNIISYLNLKDMSEEDQLKVVGDLEQKIQEQVVDECVDMLDKNKKEQLDQLIDVATPEKVIDFLKENIPSFETILKSVSSKIVDEYKSSLADLS